MHAPIVDFKSNFKAREIQTGNYFRTYDGGMTMTWWKRLDERRKELGWNKAELSRRSGIPYDNINKYLRGDIDQPRGDVLETLAETVKRPLLWLRDGIDAAQSELTLVPGRMVAAPVVGRVEAGAFREVDPFDQSERELISVPPDERFPHARQLVFDVTGDSMNNLRPRPIFDGDRVIAVAYEDVASEAVLRDGMVVVVERTRDGGHTREWSVKQVEIYEGRTEFHPRSNNPKHRPIVVERDAEADDGTRVEVIGLVRRVQNDLAF
ncbi:helix-turn-helix domain-containing protein [Ensifer adhaerens]|uniref:LexA family transcriptional regulator n=1 Tax=Ensifer adhaerens TaxID=106592 RepID=UPI001CBB3E2B|nr:S24 family peptidase [Ensifer adhaerens]MBZ7923131.1 helix-turn-helix domain-containing protein [Ensifer adhaerens]UAX91719.1 helix-turn-helix domain-containing protein [Ensifer adhaerens]UAX99347.1 helix-turn-helix domain-containing protein [Ensifer adhaerens]UAY06730.1 helix-turn-helix domain-containing protein [Ensifer adhaerens]